MIAHGIPIFVALEPVDMRLGAERLGALVREKMRTEPRARALFAFVGKRGHTMKVLTWDGTGTILIHKKLDAGRFELPRATMPGEQHLQISWWRHATAPPRSSREAPTTAAPRPRSALRCPPSQRLASA